MGTILDRGYVFKKGTALVPTFVAFSVTQLLEQALRPARRLRLHRPHGGRPRPHRGRRRGAGRLAAAASTSATANLASMQLVTDHLDEHRRPRRQLDRDPRIRHRRPGRALRAVPRARRRNARAFPTTSRPTSSHRRRPRSCWRSPPSERTLGAHPETGRHDRRRKDGRYGPYVTEVPRRRRGRKAANGIALRVDVPRHDHARRGASGCSRCRERSTGHGGRGDRRRERALRPVRQERSSETRSLESEEQLLTLTVEQAEALLAQPKQRRGRGAPKAPLKELGRRSCEREANRGQGRSVWPVRHGRRDQCELARAATPSRGSRSSEPSSCSPKDALRARKASRRRGFRRPSERS